MSTLPYAGICTIFGLATLIMVAQAYSITNELTLGGGMAHTEIVSCEKTYGKLTVLADALTHIAEELSKAIDNQPTHSPRGTCNLMVTFIRNQANNIVRQVNLVKHVELNIKLTEITDEFNDKLREYKKKVFDLVAQEMDEPIHACSFLIKNGKYQVDSVEHNTLNDCLPDVIKNMYANNLDNFESVLKLIEDLPWISHHYRGYESLFNEMNQNNQLSNSEIIRLAYLVKETITKASKLDFNIATKVAEPLENLKNRFPMAVRNLIWNGDCTIRHSIRNEFLYAAADDLKNQNGDRRVFTWIPDTQDKDASWKLWEFVPVDNATYFHIKNTYQIFNVHLSQDRTGISSPDAAVACDSNCHNSTKWKLEFKNGYFNIINGQSGKYLTTLDGEKNYDSERRNVFISQTTGSQQKNWVLDCVELP